MLYCLYPQMKGKTYKIRLTEAEYSELCTHKPISKYIRSRLFGGFVPTNDPKLPPKDVVFVPTKSPVPSEFPRIVPTISKKVEKIEWEPMEDWYEGDIKFNFNTGERSYKGRVLTPAEDRAWLALAAKKV